MRNSGLGALQDQAKPLQPFPVCHHDGFTDEKQQKKAPWHMMFADDVMLCATEKDVLELELEQWSEALDKSGMKA